MTALRDAQFYLRSMLAMIAIAKSSDDRTRLSEVEDLATLIDSKLTAAMREETERERQLSLAELRADREERIAARIAVLKARGIRS